MRFSFVKAPEQAGRCSFLPIWFIIVSQKTKLHNRGAAAGRAKEVKLFMEKRMLFVVNPRSGRAEIRNRLSGILERFAKAGYLTTVFMTQAHGDAEKLVAEIGGQFDRIAVSGGDGTVNETLNGLMRLEQRPPLAIIPAGTTNDYSYTLHIPFQMLKAADTAVGDRILTIDVGRFNERHFTYVAAFGLFTDVTYETPQDAKNILGAVAYVLEGAKRINAIRNYNIRLEYDGGVIEDDVIVALFSNAVSVAGLRTAFEDAKLDDGLLEITLVKRPKTLADMQTIIHILLNFETMRSVETDFLRVVTTRRARVTSEEGIAWTVDGESGGVFREVEIANVHRAIRVVTGEDAVRNVLDAE